MALLHGERPEHIAETIILSPTKHVPRRKDWHKRDMKIKSAKGRRYWEKTGAGITVPCALAAPIKGLKKIKPLPRPDNPTPYFTERPKFKMYSRDEFEIDVKLLEQLRALLRTRYVDGQPKFKGQYGPFVDGLTFKYHDDMVLAEIKNCEKRLSATQGIIQQAKLAKKLESNAPTPKQAMKNWKGIGNNPAVAIAFQHMNFKVRKIEAGHGNTHYYEVLPRGSKGRSHAK